MKQKQEKIKVAIKQWKKMFSKWEPVYKKILKDFNFSEKKDKKSACILNQILKDKKLASIDQIRDLIKDKEIFIFGAAPSLENSIKKYYKKFENKTKITADGATTALMNNNILPDIITTDLDGKIIDQIEANKKGSLVIIHAHGDNIDRIEENMGFFEKNILGSTQTNPEEFKLLYNFGGFTDGDRAVFLAEFFQAKKIFLIGFDYNKIGKYSYTKKINKKIKHKKLQWTKILIKKLNEKYCNITYI